MDIDLNTEPLGEDADGNPVFLADLWPTSDQIKDTVADAVRADMFTKSYADVFTGDERWRELDTPTATRYTWPDSTYVRELTFFGDMAAEPQPVEPIVGARVLALVGDSVTTDHLTRGRDQEAEPGRAMADRARRRAAGLQLVRLVSATTRS